MKFRFVLATSVIVGATMLSAPAQSNTAQLERARSDIRALRYADAESTLAEVAASASGKTLNESLFLLASLKSSTAEASSLYHRIIADDPGSEWAKHAQLELSKIKYAMGEYGESLRILEDSGACDVSDEACLFQGLSAIMLERYRDARRPLGSIRKGKLRTWAYLSLAEVDWLRVDGRLRNYHDERRVWVSSSTELHRTGAREAVRPQPIISGEVDEAHQGLLVSCGPSNGLRWAELLPGRWQRGDVGVHAR